MDYSAVELHMKEAHTVVTSAMVPSAVVPPRHQYLVRFVCGVCDVAKQRLWFSGAEALAHIDQQHSQFFRKYLKAACRLCGMTAKLEDFKGHDINCPVISKFDFDMVLDSDDEDEYEYDNFRRTQRDGCTEYLVA